MIPDEPRSDEPHHFQGPPGGALPMTALTTTRKPLHEPALQRLRSDPGPDGEFVRFTPSMLI